MKKIEVYIRHNSAGAMVNFHIPEELRQQFQKSIASGQFDTSNLDAQLEFSILPEWVGDPGDLPANISIKLLSVGVNYSDTED